MGVRLHAAECLRENTADCLYDRFVDEIVTGRLKRGTRLPTMQQIAEANGITFRVARGIVERLAREGYVRSCPHTGTIVRAKNHTIWRGRVLFVSFDDDCASYYVAQFADALRRRLVSEGYLMTSVVASRSPRGDVSQLKTALGQSVDFVVLMYEAKHLERLIASAGYRYLVSYSTAQSRPGAWSVRYGVEKALETFLTHCRKTGIRSVTEVRFRDGESSSVEKVLRAEGIRVRQLCIEPLAGYGRFEAIERASMQRFLSMKKSELPDLFLFWDDFIAQGALTALLARGINVPKDVKVVVQSNKGLGPVFPIPLTRIECDGSAVGEQVADFVLAALQKGRLPPVPRAEPKYVFGDSFPWSEK